jgi:hypothetical protein
MDFGRAFTFAFQDPDWLKKVGIAALVFLIPVIGPIVLMGWGLEITRRVINNESEALPDWSDFSAYIPKGFQAFVVSLAFMLPAILFVICGQVASIGMAAGLSSLDSDVAGGVATVVALCLTCFVTLFLIVAGFMIPAATGNLAANGELGAAFRFNEVFGLLRAAPGPYIMVILGVGLANLFLAPLGSLICGVGVLFTTAYTTCLGGHLTGQAYKVAKAAQSTAPN